MSGGRAGEQCANGLNGLTIAPDDAANVALPQLQAENDGASRRDFADDSFIGEFSKLAQDEFEKLAHKTRAGDFSLCSQ